MNEGSLTLSKAPRPVPVGRVEFCLALAIVVVGIGLRFSEPSQLAVEHFDEGVYASNIWFGPATDYKYPDQHLYAPPLLPELIYTIFTIFGPSNFGAVSVSLVAGSLTVALVWWVGRQWFGPAAGLASAALAAFSDVHIFFSRTALTDVLLCFWLLAAVYFAWLALDSGRRWAIIAAGVTTSLAWWTKYNGWLPLAISGAGAVAWFIIGRWTQAQSDSQPPAEAESAPGERTLRASPAGTHQLLATAARWLVIAGIAGLLWLPCLWSLQDRGGYAAVRRNHAGYIVGWSGWWNSLNQQFQHLKLVEGSATFNSLLLAIVVPILCRQFAAKRFTWNSINYVALCPTLLVVSLLGIPIGFDVVLAVLAGAAVIMLTVPGFWNDNCRSKAWGNSLAVWLLVVWCAGLLVATPLYTPYPRLMLPWLVSIWLLAGALLEHLSRLFDSWRVDEETSRALDRTRLERLGVGWLPISGLRAAAAALLLGAVAYVDVQAISKMAPHAWEDRHSASDLARLIRTEIAAAESKAGRRGGDVAVYIYSDPALLFQLRLLGLPHVNPVQDLNFAAADAPPPLVPSYVVIGPQARQTMGFASQFEAADQRLELIATHLVERSRLVWLDTQPLVIVWDDGPFSWSFGGTRRRQVDTITLSRVR